MSKLGMLKDDLTGKRFGRLTVLCRQLPPPKASTYWLCKCTCGRAKAVCGSSLKSGRSRSCGCYNSEVVRSRSTTHGHTANANTTRTYRVWQQMLARCRNPKNHAYSRYGGRGITVDPAWLSFDVFLANMGECPDRRHSIDRIDNNAGYSHHNCRWVTIDVQNNNKRDNRPLTLRGETMNLRQWARRVGLKRSTLAARLDRGWSVERAILTPLLTAKPG